MKITKLYNYYLTSWMKNEKNFDGKVLLDALSTFYTTSPEETVLAIQNLIEKAW